MRTQSEFPGWEADESGTLTLSVVIAGEKIRLATVACDEETGLYETFIGHQVSSNQLGRIDASQEQAARFGIPRVRAKLGQ